MKWFKNKKSEALEKQVTELTKEIATIKNESIPLSDMHSWSDLYDGSITKAGMNVTAESAMQVSAVYACVRLIAGSISQLPCNIYKRNGDDREIAKEHPLFKLLRIRPHPTVSATTFFKTKIWHYLLRGNGYSVIHRTGFGDVLRIEQKKPGEVQPDTMAGRLIYHVMFENGKDKILDQDDVLHFPNLCWDGVKGASTITQALGGAAGLALAASDFSEKYFVNDATPGGYIKVPGKMKPEQADKLLAHWTKKQSGLNRGSPAVLTENSAFVPVTISAEDMQLLESRKYSSIDIARIFGVPAHMIGENEKNTSWGTGIEQNTIGFLIFTLNDHIEMIEQELNYKLLGLESDYFIEFEFKKLLRGDFKSRNEAYGKALGGNGIPGYMTINEVRKKENLAPVENGDTVYFPPEGNDNEESTKRDDETFPGQPRKR